MRTIIVGSGRCGTHYLADVLTAAGCPCSHERVFNLRAVVDGAPIDWGGYQVSASWLALPWLGLVSARVVLLTRHPLSVVKSFVEIGYFGQDTSNPYHAATRAICPDVYDWETPQDRALRAWIHWNETAIAHADMIIRLERFTADTLAGLLRWVGVYDTHAAEAFTGTPPSGRFQSLRDRTGITHPLTWDAHDPGLAATAGLLAARLGYDPNQPQETP